MAAIHEVATITSKGQITLPKPIRQILGVDTGGKVAFDFTGDRVIVTRVTDEPHEDPAIGSFLALLEKDIQSGQHITTLPDDLARSLLARLDKQIDLDEDIQGDVAL
jgi:antitoxin PrlF